MTENITPSLQSILDAKKDDFNAKAPEEIKTMYAKGLDAVEKSGVLQKAKHIGDLAPNFTLQNAMGKAVSLSDYLIKGPVVLTWYRGGWCPYCNLTLQRLQQELSHFQAAGANLLALTPELPDQSLNTTEKNELKFEVLSDVGNKVGKDYGIIFKLTEDVAKRYQDSFDMHSYNGDDSDELPLAATYVINEDGEIIYDFLDVDYRNRAEPSEIISVLKTLK
ncbi:peroxiredoxin-like family protein [Formosa algae]|uniref:thioredoxin-dependent peroxiredoxin n=1 Tax=Formosa algae TaxID=225843 RepID=A0A9X0YIS7_9FLAO|nr:peroxiredoxin-like family protein [Formosa algae]MBP1839835.1 peroxiredoxin [Formosa algae]MDQ0335434.1 peroxiredoxin [Formosa algae]OEI79011.1 peroxiredoxin [Formosa algae]PNW28054.1 peroxiredoxin [Formosa algae]